MSALRLTRWLICACRLGCCLGKLWLGHKVRGGQPVTTVYDHAQLATLERVGAAIPEPWETETGPSKSPASTQPTGEHVTLQGES